MTYTRSTYFLLCENYLNSSYFWTEVYMCIYSNLHRLLCSSHCDNCNQSVITDWIITLLPVNDENCCCQCACWHFTSLLGLWYICLLLKVSHISMCVSIQCFDTVGLVIWPVKIVPEMTYYVSSGTLNPAHLLTRWVCNDGSKSCQPNMQRKHKQW